MVSKRIEAECYSKDFCLTYRKKIMPSQRTINPQPDLSSSLLLAKPTGEKTKWKPNHQTTKPKPSRFSNIPTCRHWWMKPEPATAPEEGSNEICFVLFLHRLPELGPHHVFFLDSAALRISVIGNIMLLICLKEMQGHNYLFFFPWDVLL